MIPWCETHRVAVVAYSPFGHDSFPGPRSAGGRVLAEIAHAHGATPRQVALAFLIRRPHVFAIPKAATLAHVEENAGAGDLQLTPDEIARIDAGVPARASAALAADAVTVIAVIARLDRAIQYARSVFTGSPGQAGR